MGNFSGCCQSREKEIKDYNQLEFERKFRQSKSMRAYLSQGSEKQSSGARRLRP
jgi:hypothetical protein